MGKLWHAPGATALVLVIAGPLGATTQALSPGGGFQLFLLGAFIAAVSALGLGAAAAIASALGRAWRGPAARGAILPLLIALGVILPNAGSVGDHPIHDITTDLEDTLQLAPQVAALRPGASREAVLAVQREKYPDIAPLILEGDLATVFARAREVAAAMPSWEVLAVDEDAGRIEALARSSLFRFEDDVVIRVRAEGEGARVDVRSRSRVGQSDLGANAARIRAYLAELAAAL